MEMTETRGDDGDRLCVDLISPEALVAMGAVLGFGTRNFADMSDFTQDSRAFAAEISDRAGVAMTPGLGFDPVRGARMLRFSYAGATADIEEGLDRLASFMAAR